MTQQSTRRPRVLVIDDHALFAESLELALSLAGFDVRRTQTEHQVTLSALLAAVVRMRPWIVVLDLDLGHHGDGIVMVKPLANAGTHVVVVTGSTDRARWGQCLRDGARIVLTKSQPLEDVLAVVRRIEQGLPVMASDEREDLIELWHAHRREHEEIIERLQLLTRREQQVLRELMRGRSVADIAAANVVTKATVRTQVKSILAKLEVSSQIAAVGMAYNVGWRSTPPLSA